MKCSKRSFAMVSLLSAELLSLSIGTLHARDADLASSIFAATQTAKQQCRTRMNDVPFAAVAATLAARPLHPSRLC
jgi:hypothetical protein